MNRLSEEIHDDDKEPASMYVKSDRVLGSQNDKGIVNKTFFVHFKGHYCILTQINNKYTIGLFIVLILDEGM